MPVERFEAPIDATDNMRNSMDNVEKPEGNAEQERPDWLQEKFQTPQDLAKAYNELEKKMGTVSGKPKAPDSPREAPHEGRERPPQETQQAEPQGQDAPFLPGLENNVAESISNYAWEHRSLDDEHYETLAKAGYSRDLVDEFMAGQFSRADAFQNTLTEAGGGAENVEAMFTWARNNLSEQQIAGYDSMFDQGGPQAIMAMENLRAKFDNSGQATNYSGVTGANAPSFDTSVFNDTAEVMKAMQDDRYHKSEHYRQEVARKLARSKNVNF